MFNKERFHNALALSLGYERIVKDKRITIDVDDSDDPWVILKYQGCPEGVRFKASDTPYGIDYQDASNMQDDIKEIVQLVHQAYNESLKPY